MPEYLQGYLADRYWCHARDVVPMIAGYPGEPGEWERSQIEDDDLLSHLTLALDHWSAFRSSIATCGRNPRLALRRHIARLILDVRAMPGARPCLSDVAEGAIEQFARTLAERLRQFGRAVKGVDSCVIGSKAAHFFLLGLVPAYDGQVIRDSVLPRLARGARVWSGTC